MEVREEAKTSAKDIVKHKCALCPYSTKTLGSYKNHLRIHSNEKHFKCSKCPFKAKWKYQVKKHVKNVHLLQSGSPRPFPCPESGCNYAAKDKSNLVKHSKIHSDIKSLFCSHPGCKFSTKHNESLTNHIRRVHTGEKPFVCQFESCSYASVTLGQLVLHSRTHTKEKPYKCPEPNCEYSTAQIGNLKRHQLSHPPKDGGQVLLFSCLLCEYSGKSKEYLLHHIRSHTLEKLFKCDEPNCNFEAKTKQEIRHHKVVHSDDKPFACSVESCEYRSKHKAALSAHLKTVHSEERPYKCELCPFRGKTRDVVRGHLNFVHSDIRPFKCAESNCDYAAKNKSKLNQHILIHKGDKKYSCSFPGCNFKTVRKFNLKKHEMGVHKK